MEASGAAVDDADADVGGVLLDGVVKRYGTQTVLDVPRLHIPHRSFTVLVGPSGCGKSTGLRVVSGLETPDSGTVMINGRDVTTTPPGGRGVSMVFQDFALYPHLTVEQNIAFSLRLEAKHDRRGGPSRAEIARRVTDACEMLGLQPLRRRRPGQLSGGERQRVGVARAIVRRPGVLLLDEPLSALDAQLRQHARAELIRLHRELGNTVILVTHDQLEALSMGTHLVVMKAGRIVQAGSPSDVYRRPAHTFVATFVGSPAMNLHHVDVVSDAQGSRLTAAGMWATVPTAIPLPRVRVGWRPADGTLEPFAAGRPSEPGLSVEGTVDVIEFTGDTAVVHGISQGAAAGRSAHDLPWTVVIPARQPAPAVGERVTVRVPHTHLHLFDPDDGHRLAEGAVG
ncbi:ABC transporter [Pseudofrankia sp. BMG5.36]|nr:ABC transporter [Pseudofrankia sp. BMG5.36]